MPCDWGPIDQQPSGTRRSRSSRAASKKANLSVQREQKNRRNGGNQGRELQAVWEGLIKRMLNLGRRCGSGTKKLQGHGNRGDFFAVLDRKSTGKDELRKENCGSCMAETRFLDSCFKRGDENQATGNGVSA